MLLSLGPFQGITDVYYRTLFQSHFGGIDKYYTPFFTGIQKPGSRSIRSKEIDPDHNDIEILTPQILSHDAAEVILFGLECQRLGYNEINLNLGCPYPRVARKKRGSGLLPYPHLLGELLMKVKAELPVKLSVKCRLGYLDPYEIDELIPMFNDYGLSELIVHARIGKQLYQGAVHDERFGQIIPNISCTLVYNGDIFSAGSLSKFSQQYPAINHWMLGRGLLADPFLALDLRNICDLNPLQRKHRLLQFITVLYLQRRRNSADRLTSLGRMKELWSYLVWSFSDSQNAWRLIRKSTDFESYENAVAEVFKLDWLGHGYERKQSARQI
jgi:tRNA-dihydrouridine synthase B